MGVFAVIFSDFSAALEEQKRSKEKKKETPVAYVRTPSFQPTLQIHTGT